MNIQNIHQGDTYKNYIALCGALQIPVQSSTSKTKQLKEMSTYFRYHRNGHKYIIDEVYPQRQVIFFHPGEDSDKIAYHVKTLLTQHLLHNDAITVTKAELYNIFGLVNETFVKEYPQNNKLESYFRQVTLKKCYSASWYSLEALQRDNIIAMASECIITDLGGKTSSASENDLKQVRGIEIGTCNNLGCHNVDEVFMKGLNSHYFFSLHRNLEKIGLSKVTYKHNIQLVDPRSIIELDSKKIRSIRQEANKRIIKQLDLKFLKNYTGDRQDLIHSTITTEMVKNHPNPFALLSSKDYKAEITRLTNKLLRL